MNDDLLKELKMNFSKGENVKPSSLKKRAPPGPPPNLSTFSGNNKSENMQNFDNYFSHQIINYENLLPSNMKRKKILREKYDCILDDDIYYITGIIYQLRNWFYSIPLINSPKTNNLIIGGIYLKYLPHRAHKSDLFWVIHYRCENDLKYTDKILQMLECYNLKGISEHKLYQSKSSAK